MVSPRHHNNGNQWTVREALEQELPTRCSEPEDRNPKIVGRNVGLDRFEPGEEKFIPLKLNRSIESVCLMQQHPSLTDQWEIAEGLVDQSVKRPGVLVRNKCFFQPDAQ